MKSRSPWLGGCLLLLTAGFGLFLLLALVLFLGRWTDDAPSSGLFSTDRIGRLDVIGPIEESLEVQEELKRLQRDPSVKALVVRVDSPGGGVAASQEIYAAIRRFSAETGRPIVASMGSVAASGGYYVACAADQIMADPGSLTGSIGVIMSFADLSRLLEKLGIRFEVVKTGAKKDFGAYWRGLTEEERAILEQTLHDVHLQFAEVVSDRRELSLEEVLALADGRIFSGREARTAGLVDTLGDLEDAVRTAARMAGLPETTPTVTKRRIEPDWFEVLRRLGEESRVLLEQTPRMEYRFR